MGGAGEHIGAAGAPVIGEVTAPQANWPSYPGLLALLQGDAWHALQALRLALNRRPFHFGATFAMLRTFPPEPVARPLSGQTRAITAGQAHERAEQERVPHFPQRADPKRISRS